MYDLSGRLCGVQYYNPSFPKKADNPKEARYFTRMGKYKTGVWGLEFPVRGPLYIVEGVFNAARLHTLGEGAIAVLSNSPIPLRSWLSCLPYETISLCDGDKAGLSLAGVSDKYEILPPGEDVSSLDPLLLNNLLEKYK